MPPGERARLERELWDLGIAAAAPVAAEISDAEERRAFEILPPDERRYWSGTLVVPYRWICSIEVYRSKVQVWAAAAEPAPKARAAVTAMVLRFGTNVLPAFLVWRRPQSGNAWAELSSPSRTVADACAAVVACAIPG